MVKRSDLSLILLPPTVGLVDTHLIPAYLAHLMTLSPSHGHGIGLNRVFAGDVSEVLPIFTEVADRLTMVFLEDTQFLLVLRHFLPQRIHSS